MVKAQQLTPPVAYHAEGAVWFPSWGGLKWVDMLAGDILSLDWETGRIDRMHTGSAIAALVRPRVAGGMVIATEREFSLWRDGCKEWSTPHLWDSRDRHFNEGGCDPAGRILCGSMSSREEPHAGEMYRLNPDGSVERLFGDITISNGLGFNAANTLMYYIDTATSRIDVFDVQAGQPVNRRPFVSVPHELGSPDGLWVDQQDGIWVALYGGSAVHHYSSQGVLEGIVDVPATQVTSCTFGGPNLDTLFITTSRENLAASDEPQAGSVFAAEVGVRGAPVAPFGG